ncbi:Pycsar system effector family protein [Kocuria sp. U4B]
MLRDLFGKEVPSSSEPYWEDAKLAIQETGNWVKNADTKTTILAAALGVLLTAIASRSADIHSSFTTSTGSYLVLLAVSLVGFALAAVIAVGCIYRALTPRTPPGSLENRFSWPSMAARDLPPVGMPGDSIAREAWEQAHTLAKIAQQKYRWFRWALRFYFGSFVSAGLLVALSS